MTVPDAHPLRRSTASFGWIERRFGSEAELLAQWNQHWRAFNLIGGHQEPGESERECLVRELQEELAVSEHYDYVADLQPMAQLAYIATSVRTGELTEYQITLYRVQLQRSIMKQILANSANRWLTRTEIKSGRTYDGRAVSETIGRWLEIVD